MKAGKRSFVATYLIEWVIKYAVNYFYINFIKKIPAFIPNVPQNKKSQSES